MKSFSFKYVILIMLAVTMPSFLLCVKNRFQIHIPEINNTSDLLAVWADFHRKQIITTCAYLGESVFSKIETMRSSREPESEKIIALRAKKEAFENQLKVSSFNATRKKFFSKDLPFCGLQVQNDPTVFLQYAYYISDDDIQTAPLENMHGIDRHTHGPIHIFFQIERNDIQAIKNSCIPAAINGYSALGAALISKTISRAQKRVFLQQLLDLGFKTTPGDHELAYLEAYDASGIRPGAKFMLALGRNDKNCILTKLPPEIFFEIISYFEKKPLLQKEQ